MSLTIQEVMIAVNKYIGVNGGYLGNFSYRTHQEFYSEYCGLEIDVSAYEGTTRERFLLVLRNASPMQQAKIIRGMLERFPIGEINSPETRTVELQRKFRSIASRLEERQLVGEMPKISREAAYLALEEAEMSIKQGNPVGAVDRMHTAIHGYLLSVCNESDFTYNNDDSISKLFKTIRRSHPKLVVSLKNEYVETFMGRFSGVFDSLSPIRNHLTLSHPNERLVEEDEAIFIVNSLRSILQYLHTKL